MITLVDALVRERAEQMDPIRVTFPEALLAIYTARYSGPVTVHFTEGQPKAVQIPNPVQVKCI